MKRHSKRCQCNLCVMFREQSPPGLAGNTSSAWPMKMNSLGVHPSQVKDAIERNKKHGVHVTYDKKGTPIVADRRQRRELMKIEHQNLPGGIRDKSGGFGEDFTADALPVPKKNCLKTSPNASRWTRRRW